MNGSWKTAVTATLHCLTGCAIGEVLGMVLATWWGWGNVGSIVLSVVLAFFFGYLLTFSGVRRAGLDVPRRSALALGRRHRLDPRDGDRRQRHLLVWPAALDAGLADLLFWVSLAVSLAVAFVVTVPVNRWMIARGKGHAVVHEMHSGHEMSDHEPATDRPRDPSRP